MTVAELIARLQNFPANFRVVVEARESGYNDVGVPLSIALTPNNADRSPGSIGSFVEDFDGEEALLIAAPPPP